MVEDYIRNQEKEDMVRDNLSTKEHVDPFKGVIKEIIRRDCQFSQAPRGACEG